MEPNDQKHQNIITVISAHDAQKVRHNGANIQLVDTANNVWSDDYNTIILYLI